MSRRTHARPKGRLHCIWICWSKLQGQGECIWMHAVDVTALHTGHMVPAPEGQVCPLPVYIPTGGTQREVLWLLNEVKRCNGTGSWDEASLYATWTGVSSGTGQRTNYVLLLTVLCLLIGADLADQLPIWDAIWDCGLMVAWWWHIRVWGCRI